LNPEISASDKDFSPVITKLFKFVTIDLFEQLAAVDSV